MSYRRRLALRVGAWLNRLAFWLDRTTVKPYDPAADKLRLDLTDDEWEEWQAAVLGADRSR